MKDWPLGTQAAPACEAGAFFQGRLVTADRSSFLGSKANRLKHMGRTLKSDRVLFGTTVGLVCLSIVMVWSASAVVGMERHQQPYLFLTKQLLWATLGLAVMWAAMDIDYRRYREPRFIWACVAVVAVSLFAVLFSPPVNNARRWFSIGGLGIQPSELAKLAAIFFMAGVFKQIAKHSPQEGALTAMTLYAAWWMAGAMLVLATVSLRSPQALRAVAHRFPSMATVAGRLYVFLPFVSLLVHLCGANRVYALQFNSANVAPVLLGVAVLLMRWQSQFPRRFILGIQTTLVGVAVLISMPFVPQLYLHVGSHLISPLRLTLAGSAGVLGVVFFQSWQLMAAQIAACTLMAAGLGNSPAEMQRNSLELAKIIFAQTKRLIPETQMQWGIIAVVSSFVMLGIGALVSLRRQPSRNLISMLPASGDMDRMSPDLPSSNE